MHAVLLIRSVLCSCLQASALLQEQTKLPHH
jgi:hypothetical protein